MVYEACQPQKRERSQLKYFYSISENITMYIGTNKPQLMPSVCRGTGVSNASNTVSFPASIIGSSDATA